MLLLLARVRIFLLLFFVFFEFSLLFSFFFFFSSRRRHTRSLRDWSSDVCSSDLDVGAGRAKAFKQDDGSWHIEGVKRFITGAAQEDMSENIIHLVLARPEGPGIETKPGTKGLGLRSEERRVGKECRSPGTADTSA